MNGKNEKAILNKISFKILPTQKIGIVGVSGSGKSTIINLLMRLYEYEGEITLDGINIMDYDLKTYRRYFSIVNQ